VPDAPSDTPGAPSAGRLRPFIGPAVALALLAVVVVATQVVGVSARSAPAPQQRVYEVADAREGFARIQELNPHGRVFVLLDKSPRVSSKVYVGRIAATLSGREASLPVTPDNFTSTLITAGMVRGAYQVVATPAWAEIAQSLASKWEALPDGPGFVRRVFGAPIYTLPETAMPAPDEKVIVWIPRSVASTYDPAFIKRVTDPSFADVVIVQDGP
jgi:hypothetical protein